MTKKDKVWAIVPAGGVGRRMGADIPKQYMSVHGKPLIHHTLSRICSSPLIDGVIVGIQESDEWWPQGGFRHANLIDTYEAGAQRADTVLNGLSYLLQHPDAAESDWVLVHDAVRPCILQQDIENLIKAARESQSGAILGGNISDTMKTADRDNRVVETVERGVYWRAYTPQMFRISDLVSGLVSAISSSQTVTDESMAMEYLGIKPVLVPGHPSNIKLTYSEDLKLVEIYLEAFQ